MPLQELAEVSIPASLSNPRLARSYTKISTNTPRPPLMENLGLEPFSAAHLPLKWPLRPQDAQCTTWKCKMCKFHGLGMVISPPPLLPPTFGSWLFSLYRRFDNILPAAAAAAARSRSANFTASSCAEENLRRRRNIPFVSITADCGSRVPAVGAHLCPF